MTTTTRNLVEPEIAEYNRTGRPGGYTFNAMTPDDYEGDVLVFGCVRIGDHAHIEVESGRSIPNPHRTPASLASPILHRGVAGKLILRWHEWELLRGILDTDPRVRIAEVENPTVKMAEKYA